MHAVNTIKHIWPTPILVQCHLGHNIIMSGLTQVLMFKTPTNPWHQRNIDSQAVLGIIRQYFFCPLAGD